VQTGTIEDSTEFIAQLVSRHSVELKPRIQGQVSEIFVRSGDSLPQGAEILQVDARQQKATVESNRAGSKATKAQIENARATLKSLEAQRLSNLADVQLNQKEYERYSRLATEGAVSRETGDQYLNKIATAKATLSATNANIQAQQFTISQLEKTFDQAKANIREQQVQLQYYKINAPFAGTVGDIPVKVGDFVTTATTLTTITQNQPLEVYIYVPLERGPQLHNGLPIEVMNTQGKEIASSKVFFISPVLSSDGTQSILVKAILNNSNSLLRANQFVQAKVIWSQRSGAIMPTSAVSRVAGDTFAFVPQTEKSPQGTPQLVARQKRVELGEIKGNNYQVLEGLQPNEKIIVSGVLNLRDGIPITTESK
jgi:RND family efflux transporter MFP subunit